MGPKGCPETSTDYSNAVLPYFWKPSSSFSQLFLVNLKSFRCLVKPRAIKAWGWKG
jgi:hypothetical protein